MGVGGQRYLNRNKNAEVDVRGGKKTTLPARLCGVTCSQARAFPLRSQMLTPSRASGCDFVLGAETWGCPIGCRPSPAKAW